MAADFNPNVVTGLASGMDTKSIVKQLIEAEKKKVEPIKARQEQKTLELDTWKQVKSQLEKVKTTSDVLSKKSMWEGKIVSSSNPEVVEALATSGAKPGKHTLVVDKLALSHQVASQSFEEKDTQIGQGKVVISVGEGEPETMVIDNSNNTLQGFANAINQKELGVTANIIKTGSKTKPYQIVLTSAKTGLEGKINIQVELDGELESPTFDPYYSQPDKWKGIKKLEEAKAKQPTGVGASTAIPELVGEYQGTEPLDLKFTVVNTGIVGTAESLRLRWEDNQDRYGYLDLGSFNYTPGEPIAVVDGISLIMSEGEILVNDTFEAKAKPQESELFWWKDATQRAPRIGQPKSWGKQATEGGPIITGKLDTGEDDRFTLKVIGNGTVGDGEVQIEYTSENGLKGTAYVGSGYTPGSKLSLGHGLELTLNSGILTDGATATFDYQAGSTENFWWLDDAEQTSGDLVKNLTQWIQPEEEEEEEVIGGGEGLAQVRRPKGPRISNAKAQIVGKYDSFESKVYTFTALNSGAIGVTKGLELKWEDSQGNSGTLEVGDGYQRGEPIAFDSGLSLVLGEGDVFETDSFNFRTFSPVIQPPQDAEVRLGATELGGGLTITNPTNVLDDVIDGVKLTLVATDPKPVTISIKGDTETAVKSVLDFVASYNEMLNYFQEVTKYDKDTKVAGPLQGDRNLPRIQAEMNRIFIDTVKGLPQDSNQLMALGLRLGDDGLIKVDEDKVQNLTEDNLAKVANLFRSYGEIENPGITYLSSSAKTKISGEEGYKLDITAAATRGFYATRPLLQMVEITEANQSIFVKVNGRESAEIKLNPGQYDIASLAKELQRAIIEDKFLVKLNIAVTQDEGRIVVRSNMTGARSSVTIRPKDPQLALTHPLAGGNSTDGLNVQGTIDGVEMNGAGQILSGPEGTKYEGLKLYVSLSDKQISEQTEGTLVFTKGVGTKVTEYIEKVMNPENGSLGTFTKNVEDQLKGYDKEVKVLEKRIEAKREKLKAKFANMEAKLGKLKSEQSYLTQQLSKLG